MRNLAWLGRDPRPLTRQLRSPCAHLASIIPTVPSSLAQNSKSMHYIGWRSSENKWFEGWKGGVPVLDIRVRIFVWCFPIWFTEILHNSALASGHHNEHRQKICLASDKDPTHDLWLDDCNHPAPVWTVIIFFIQVLLLILLKHVYLRNLVSQRLYPMRSCYIELQKHQIHDRVEPIKKDIYRIINKYVYNNRHILHYWKAYIGELRRWIKTITTYCIYGGIRYMLCYTFVNSVISFKSFYIRSILHKSLPPKYENLFLYISLCAAGT